MDVLLSILPIVLLVFFMTKKNSLPSHLALPLTALLISRYSALIHPVAALFIPVVALPQRFIILGHSED